ncbi:hypothetical protein B0H14DRAFT_2631441 [Mycena olivaceomarginata]|nr:hypothetical protein B0H14DRAFT_2631441 [Mycena olivaceomarginata]
MCDAISTSMIFGALSLLPGNRYILWALVSTGLIICAANRQRSSHKLGRVKHQIQTCEELLKHAKGNCPRNLGSGWMGRVDYLRFLKGQVVGIEDPVPIAGNTQFFNMGGVGGISPEPAQHYAKDQPVRKGRGGNSKIDTGLRIQAKGFQLPIEAERQREFFEGIKELREIHDTVISASERGSYADGNPPL